MVWTTAFTEMTGVRYPIVSAPMGGSAGGALAAAVSNAGGFGMVGGGNGHPKWLEPELEILAGGTSEPWGVGLLSWAVDPDAVERVLEHNPAAVLLSFGTTAALAEPVLHSAATLILQVTSMDEAREAVDLGADVIVAQGTEAGGHGARRGRSTLPFVPAVVDLVAPTPVMAAGGIADGRGLAAALVLGASGVVIGSRFQATAEAIVDPAVKKAIVDGRGEDTERSSILDIASGSRWPLEYTGRTLGHPVLDQWRGREAELTADPPARDQARRAYRDAVARGDAPPQPVWAGEAADLITDLPPAAEVVAALVREAELAWSRVGG
ncbi:MAG TPA: nitronate monooxygenase [Streptosporangiaceae bacterium]|jgi:nitronate monooxygenase|nr:nitronate monooxygenase [Streptosporangiaceae bacterium]